MQNPSAPKLIGGTLRILSYFFSPRSLLSSQLSEKQESSAKNFDRGWRVGHGIRALDDDGFDPMGKTGLHRLNHKIPPKVRHYSAAAAAEASPIEESQFELFFFPFFFVACYATL